MLDTSGDRKNAVAPRNFSESDFPRTKMLQNVVGFGFLERPAYSQ